MTGAAVALALLVASACSGGGGDSAAPTTVSTGGTAASACAKPADDSAEPFVLGVVDTTVGPTSYPGPGHGAAAAAAYANCELGGVDGHPVKTVGCAAGPDAPSQDHCGTELAANPDVRMVLTGYVFAPDGLYAALAYAGKPVLGGIPIAATDFTSPAVRFYSAGAPGVAGGLVAYALGNLDTTVHHAVVVVSNDGVLPSVQPLLEASGATVSVVEAASPDLGAALAAAGAEQADAVFALVDQAGCVALAGARVALNPAAPVLTTSQCLDGAVLDAVGLAGLDGWYVGSERPLPQLDPGSDASIDAYRTLYPQYAQTDPEEAGASTGWANVLAAVDALGPLGFDAATGPVLLAGLDAYHGPQPLGPPHLSCPGATYPTMCTTESYVARISAGHVVAGVAGDAPVDVSTFDPSAYKVAHP
jgi:branched-chain amino acid transport system substrate-binding protein